MKDLPCDGDDLVPDEWMRAVLQRESQHDWFRHQDEASSAVIVSDSGGDVERVKLADHTPTLNES
ncbi:hypothetical protein PQQ51_04040 [Paraburkholderia xenovorans]|uniref:hypothetical protein n=1 Tax=Paraburkholderia xenovorans TaxID=36873 RepID=UPI0038BC346C